MKQSFPQARPTKELEQVLGHSFQNPSLLIEALTHPSRSNEVRDDSPQKRNYEQLEFLGDAILSFTVADYLYRHYSHLDEGILSSARKEVVEQEALQSYAKRISLGNYIFLGRGAQDLRKKSSVLENVFEALIGALYLDAGLPFAQSFILGFVQADIEKNIPNLVKYGSATDSKTRLQQFIQGDPKNRPELEYIVKDRQGPDHNPTFTCAVRLDGEEIGVGTGPSRQKAEEDAAQQALSLFASDNIQ